MPKQNLYFTSGPTSMMTMCQCGDVFQETGDHGEVSAHHRAWSDKHAHCTAKSYDGRKVFWLSFCDGKRPKGQQFLGACVVEVTGKEAEACVIDMLLRFPMAQPDAEWIAAAIKKAHALGCNPGGEVATMEIPADHPNVARYQFGVLMDRAMIDRLEPPASPEDKDGST